MARIGILPLGRPTFDVELAEQQLAALRRALATTNCELIGSDKLLLDMASGRAAVDQLVEKNVDRVLVLQVTFTDAALIGEVAERLDAPLSIWAVPEPRTGGRLRLNSFCGLNLASHALGLRQKCFSWLYCDPQLVSAEELAALLDGSRDIVPHNVMAPPVGARDINNPVIARIRGKRIGRIGTRPDGFDTCAYDNQQLESLTGVVVDELELSQLFEAARAAPDKSVAEMRQTAASALSDLDTVDQEQLDKSLRLKVALDAIRKAGNYQAFALRCWPETFTEYGGAVCGPAAILGEGRIPCACEADVYGALSQLILQEVADAPVFLTDLVDMDERDNSGVFWHCGQAPLSMCDPDAVPSATIHTNRKMPLLYEFPLRPGRVTLMRVSQGRGQTKMILSGGEMLSRPKAFTGTSGIVRFDRHVSEVLPDMMNCGVEHHMVLTYGEHRPVLRDVAAALDLPLLEF